MLNYSFNCATYICTASVVFSCSQQLQRSLGWLVGWLVHKNSPLFGGHSFHPRRLKFGIEIVCVCVCVCVCEGVYLCLYQLAKRAQGNGSGLLQKGT